MCLKGTRAGIFRMLCTSAWAPAYTAAIVALIVLSSPLIAFSQDDKTEFDHLTVEDGLPAHGVF